MIRKANKLDEALISLVYKINANSKKIPNLYRNVKKLFHNMELSTNIPLIPLLMRSCNGEKFSKVVTHHSFVSNDKLSDKEFTHYYPIWYNTVNNNVTNFNGNGYYPPTALEKAVIGNGGNLHCNVFFVDCNLNEVSLRQLDVNLYTLTIFSFYIHVFSDNLRFLATRIYRTPLYFITDKFPIDKLIRYAEGSFNLVNNEKECIKAILESAQNNFDNKHFVYDKLVYDAEKIINGIIDAFNIHNYPKIKKVILHICLCIMDRTFYVRNKYLRDNINSSRFIKDLSFNTTECDRFTLYIGIIKSYLKDDLDISVLGRENVLLAKYMQNGKPVILHNVIVGRLASSNLITTSLLKYSVNELFSNFDMNTLQKSFNTKKSKVIKDFKYNFDINIETSLNELICSISDAIYHLNNIVYKQIKELIKEYKLKRTTRQRRDVIHSNILMKIQSVLEVHANDVSYTFSNKTNEDIEIEPRLSSLKYTTGMGSINFSSL